MYAIRFANEDDYDKIGQLLSKVYRDYDRRHKDNVARVVEIAKAARIFVADLNGQIIGTAAVELSNESKYPEFPTNSAYVRAVAVDAQYRRQGIGTALMQSIENLANLFGKTSLVLRTFETMVEAQKMYEKYGFKRAPDMDWKYPKSGIRLLAYLYNL